MVHCGGALPNKAPASPTWGYLLVARMRLTGPLIEPSIPNLANPFAMTGGRIKMKVQNLIPAPHLRLYCPEVLISSVSGCPQV